MENAWSFLTQHSAASLLALYWVFSAIVDSMPDLGPNSGSGYLWLYRFLHTIAGNVTTAFSSKIPGLITGAAKGFSRIGALIMLVVVSVFLMIAAGCHGYQVHPGSINQFDSVTYDVLIAAQAAILEAHNEVIAGTFPPAAKTVLINLEKSYNLAETAYQAWHVAAASNDQSVVAKLTALQNYVPQLTAAVTAFQKAK